MSDYDALVTLLDPFLRADISTRSPWYGIRAQHWHTDERVLSYDISGPMVEPVVTIQSPAEARAFALARYEKLLAALRADRWVLLSAPEIKFRSHLNPAYWTLDGNVQMHGHEDMIEAEVSIEVARAKRDLSTEVHE
jgi:hypothetical protein